MDSGVTLDEVRAAAARIGPHIHRTPVMTCAAIDRMAGATLYFKCENLQKVGAFKARGACNAVFSLGDREAARGVTTHSSGNHAQALAYAARLRGIPACIVMPENAPEVKKRAVAGYGAEIVYCTPTLEARETTTARVIAERGAGLVHPYDDDRVIAGQGTAALELIEDVPDLEAIAAPVGGGGLMSGTCIAARGIAPRVRLFGAEPAGADDAKRSIECGAIQPPAAPNTVADGLLTALGERTFPILQRHLEDIVVVDDDAILAAMKLVWERMKLVVEPSAAVPLAAALAPGSPLRGLRLGIVLSGGNVDLALAARLA